MPVATTDVQSAARTFRRQLLKRESAARADMARQWSVVRQGIGRRADDLLREIEKRGVRSANELFRLERYQDFVRYATAEMEGYSAAQWREAVSLTDFAARFGAESAAEFLSGEAGAIGQMLTMPNERALEYLVGRVKFGKAAESFKTTPKSAAQAVTRKLVEGLGSGQHPYVVAAGIRQAVDIVGYAAQRIARTEMLTAYRAANLDTMKMSGVVEMWRWEATFDDNTCEICWAMHGQLFSMEETFDTHVNCRCAPIPVTMSYAEMLRDPDAAGIEWTSQADRDTGEDIFAGLDRERQLDILGPGRLEAYENGTPLSAMVTHTYDQTWGGQRGLVPVRDL